MIHFALFDIAPDGLWPITISGWVTLVMIMVGAVVSGGGAVYAWGKWTQTVNGFGDRVRLVEQRQDRGDGQAEAMQRSLTKVLSQHDILLEKLGEAKHSSEQCHERTETMGRRIEVKIDLLTNRMVEVDKDLSGKVAALEATGKRLHHDT